MLYAVYHTKSAFILIAQRVIESFSSWEAAQWTDAALPATIVAPRPSWHKNYLSQPQVSTVNFELALEDSSVPVRAVGMTQN